MREADIWHILVRLFFVFLMGFLVGSYTAWTLLNREKTAGNIQQIKLYEVLEDVQKKRDSIRADIPTLDDSKEYLRARYGGR